MHKKPEEVGKVSKTFARGSSSPHLQGVRRNLDEDGMEG